MGGHAWVTLATNDSYSLGALVLAHSLKQVGTQQQLAVLITPGVTGSMRSKLSEVFNVVIEVNLLDSKDETNLRLLKRPELGVTFTKLHCWRLTQFDKCVFLDADTLVLENCDELFDREEFSAAPDIGWPDCFNSGVFVFRPSMETYEKLIQFALEKGSFDGGDQGLLNLYFSDWAHKDISKHLPFIYNMASTACYSYLPAFKQFGKSAKIIHFIGSSKPWLQYFDTESRKVHPAEGVQHLQEVLQLWWNIFCNLIHPNLSPEMTSHTDTVHGSQSSTYQSPSQSCPTPTASSPAEDYQKVWDPWEEYDSRQQSNQPHSQISHENHIPSQISDNQHINIEIVQTHHPTEHHNIQGHPVVHHNIQSHPVVHHNIQSHPGVHHNIQSHPVEHHNIQSRPIEHHNIQNHPVEHHNIQSGSVEHNFQRHAVQNHDIQSHSGHKEHIESLNTNACTEADNHHHDHPNPVYSQPQSPAIVPIPEHLFPTKPPPTNDPPAPKLPDECMATTTVSNEMTLQTDSKEDSKESNAGLAGAFAKLTLGAPRTAEQQALDDHLRRQGWEVGNIDYLGRDSFANIWNKICQTLSSAPEEPSATKEPSPPAVESKPVVDLPVEVKSDEQSMGDASSDIQPIKQVLEAEPVQTKGVEQVTPLPLAETPQPEACSRITVTKQIEQAEAIKLKDTVESKTEAEATDTPAPVVELAKVTETAPAQSQPVETLTSDISVPTEHTPTSEPQPATPVLPVAPVPEPSQPPPEQPSPPTLDTLPATKGSAPDIPVAPVLESPKLPPLLSTPTLESRTATESPTSATPVATEPSQPSSEPVDSTVPVSAIPQPTYPVTDSPDTTSEKPQPSVQTSETPVPPPTKAVCPMRKPVKNVDVPVIPVTATSGTTGQPAAPKVQTLQAQVTAHSPPASPESPQIEKGKVAKEALTGETIVPATGQPASAPKVPIAQTQLAQVTGPSPPASPESPQPEQGKVAKGALKVETAVPATGQPAAPKVPIAHAQKPHAQVTGPSPPASPDSPQPEQEKVANEALKVETTVPATPPPVTQQTSSGPTPPPRKSSGGTKKAAKPKK